MMTNTTESVLDAQDREREWLKTRERFGSLVEASTLKALASQGFTE